MFLLVIYFLFSIVFSFVCSVLEAVLLSVTPTFINIKIKNGKSYAHQLQKLKTDVDKPLIAILTLNTIAHTVGAILVGAQAAIIFGSSNVGIISGIMTAAILIFSEIIPKTIGASYWEQLAFVSTRTLQGIIFPLHYTGILWILQFFTRFFDSTNSQGSAMSQEDFEAVTDAAQASGVFEEDETAVIKNLLNYKSVQAKDIMTPTPVISLESEKTTINEFYQKHPKLKFSRIPVYGDQQNHVTGFVLKDEILEKIISNEGDQTLSTLRRDILLSDREVSVPELFKVFLEKRAQITLVVDEFGSTSGIVTMEDIIETLLGLEIVDESDSIEDLQLLARKNWEQRAKRLGIIEEEDQTDENTDPQKSESSD